MIYLTEQEVRSVIALLTKHKNVNQVILGNFSKYTNDNGDQVSISPSVLGLCNEDKSVIIPMYNWEEMYIQYYMKQSLSPITIMSDSEFAFQYTPSRVVTWRSHRSSDDSFMNNKIKQYNKAAWNA